MLFLQGSIIQYTRPSDVEKELNDHFHEKHDIDPLLTLSQIRNVKLRLIAIARRQDIEMSTVAIAFVLFEKLVKSVSL